MIKQQTIASIHAITFSIIYRYAVSLFATPYGLRDKGGSRSLLKDQIARLCFLIDLGFFSKPKILTDSKIRKVPSASQLAVYSGLSKLTAT